MADRILVLADGRILEEGTHDELLAKEGEYARFFKLQAESYQTAPAGPGDAGGDGGVAPPHSELAAAS